MTSRASPLSPVERDLTAVMLVPAAAGTSRHPSTSAGAEIPHNASSWELLDIMAASTSLPPRGDAQPCNGAGLHSVAPTSTTVDADAKEAIITLAVDGANAATTMMSEVSHAAAVTAAAETPAAEPYGVAESGRISPARSESTDWSLVSTPSEVHLTCGVGDLAQQTGNPLTYHMKNDSSKDVAAAHGAAVAETSMPRTAVPAALGLAQCPSQTFSVASVPPTPSPPTRGGVSVLDGGWSATSYEEVRMHDVAQTTPVLSMLVEADLTMPPLHGADEMGEKSTHTLPAIQLPASPAAEEEEGANNEQHNGEEEASSHAEASASMLNGAPLPSHKGNSAPSSTPSSGMTWVERVRHALRDSVADHLPSLSPASPLVPPEGKAAQKAPQWSTRRLSFLSSSATAAATTIVLSAGLLPRSPLSPPSHAATDKSAPVGNGENTFTTRADNFSSSCPSVPSASSPPSSSFTAVLATDVAQWWSWTRLRCADGSHHALRGLHSLCDYVWMDLKDHWYPQLRLVLGDHSCATKVRRVQRARRRLADKKTERHATDAVSPPAAAATAASTEPRSWRSVSAPCLIGGVVRASPTISAAPARHGGGCTGACAHGTRKRSRSSSRHGLQLCYAMTADAVASAAQGLLVFLL